MLWMLLFLLLFLPFMLAGLYFNLALFSFARLGLSPGGALFLLLASLVGSLINIPVSRRRVYFAGRQPLTLPFLFFYYPPQVQQQVICVNVGGAVIPALLSLYLLATRAPLPQSVLATIVVTLVARALARPVPGVGISLPAFIPPLVAAVMALLLAPGQAAPVAYVAGALGTLIGADLLNWHVFRRLQAQAISIGGAGVFDGIFLVAIVAAFLS